MGDLLNSFASSTHRVFHSGELEAQQRIGVLDEAQEMSELILDRIGVGPRRLVESMPFFFLTAAAADGALVVCDIVERLRDSAFAALPLLQVTDGGKSLSFALIPRGNISTVISSGAEWSVGLLFVDFLRNGARYRINGRARTLPKCDSRYAGVWPPSCAVVEVDVHQAYPNCTKRVIRMEAQIE